MTSTWLGTVNTILTVPGRCSPSTEMNLRSSERCVEAEFSAFLHWFIQIICEIHILISTKSLRCSNPLSSYLHHSDKNSDKDLKIKPGYYQRLEHLQKGTKKLPTMLWLLEFHFGGFSFGLSLSFAIGKWCQLLGEKWPLTCWVIRPCEWSFKAGKTVKAPPFQLLVGVTDSLEIMHRVNHVLTRKLHKSLGSNLF